MAGNGARDLGEPRQPPRGHGTAVSAAAPLRSTKLSFNLAAKGTVTVTGQGVRRYRGTLGAGFHQVEVALSRAGLTMRARHRRIAIRVAWRSGGKASSAVAALRL